MTRAKTDCFAYKPGQQKPPRRKAECMALDKLYCRDGECRFYKDRQDMAGYPESEYGTSRPSATALIRAQGEQIRRMSAEEYLKDKSRETVKRNRGLLSKISTEADGKEKWSK